MSTKKVIIFNRGLWLQWVAATTLGWGGLGAIIDGGRRLGIEAAFLFLAGGPRPGWRSGCA